MSRLPPFIARRKMRRHIRNLSWLWGQQLRHSVYEQLRRIHGFIPRFKHRRYCSWMRLHLARKWVSEHTITGRMRMRR
jgi:hypothetical protein